MHKVLGHQAVSTTGGALHLLLRQRLHTLFSAQAVRSYMPRMQVRVRGGVCSVLRRRGCSSAVVMPKQINTIDKTAPSIRRHSQSRRLTAGCSRARSKAGQNHAHMPAVWASTCMRRPAAAPSALRSFRPRPRMLAAGAHEAKDLTFQIMMEVVMGLSCWSDRAAGQRLRASWQDFTTGIFTLPVRWAGRQAHGWAASAHGRPAGAAAVPNVRCMPLRHGWQGARLLQARPRPPAADPPSCPEIAAAPHLAGSQAAPLTRRSRRGSCSCPSCPQPSRSSAPQPQAAAPRARLRAPRAPPLALPPALLPRPWRCWWLSRTRRARRCPTSSCRWGPRLSSPTLPCPAALPRLQCSLAP
jgi:hypothetical protein